MEKYYDIVIVGAGPAGLAAAITAKTAGPEISAVILEKKEKAAKKLSASGNGRGNLSNERCESLEQVLRFFSQSGIAVRRSDLSLLGGSRCCFGDFCQKSRRTRRGNPYR